MFCTSTLKNTHGGATKKIIVSFLLSLFLVPALAQNITVKGTVVDEKGQPVIAASVRTRGSRLGTATNESGTFYLRCPPGSTIICSALGYISREKTLREKDSGDSLAVITITLTAIAGTELDAVTVVSTGLNIKRQPKELGYASTTLTSKSISSGRVSALNGRVSSVSVSATSSAPKKSRMSPAPAATVDDKTTSPYSEKDESRSRGFSRMLTAGEVSDFKKWTMWEDYNKNDFATYSKQWGLFATHRYCVQLQNTAFKAVVGEKVFLVDRNTGDTLWTAVSDNTGKAELWSEFTGQAARTYLYIAVEKEAKQFPAVPFTQGINRITLNTACGISDRVEIAFLVDATGSMQDEINYLKDELGDVLGKVATKNPGLDLQTGAVFYRDKGDEYLTKMQQFSRGTKNTIDFIKQQNADGGGDYPESLNAGLDTAIEKLHWSTAARTRIIFLLMDAPPHDEAKTQMQALIGKAAAMGIRIVPVACSGTDKPTEFIMRSIALATNGDYLFLTDDSGIGDSHIKPTTNEFKVELLNDLLQRIIEQMCFVNPCDEKITAVVPVSPYLHTGTVRVFPNPTNGPVTLKISQELKEIYITDFTGKILSRTEIRNKASNYPVDLSGLPSAVYFIRYITKTGETGAEKVVLLR